MAVDSSEYFTIEFAFLKSNIGVSGKTQDVNPIYAMTWRTTNRHDTHITQLGATLA
jgi:hypothetical protein